jgi:uncharacterized lipoprotein YmbA
VLAARADLSRPTSRGAGKQWRIGLAPVEVPAYLRGKEMVVRTGANEIQFAEYDRWAESLDQGIGRAIKENLASAPNVASVALNSRGGDTLDYEVAMRVLACEGVRVRNRSGSIRFAAAWNIRATGTNAPPAKSGGFTAAPVSWDGRDYGQLAGRLSEAIAAASQVLAADLPLEFKAAAQPAPATGKP